MASYVETESNWESSLSQGTHSTLNPEWSPPQRYLSLQDMECGCCVK